VAAGVDFPCLLFADQPGLAAEPCHVRLGVRWVGLLTDLPVGLGEIARGQLGLRDYLHSLRGCDTEAVFAMRRRGVRGICSVPVL
jgi:D-aspartate ligase